jgi:hypothetical protein
MSLKISVSSTAYDSPPMPQITGFPLPNIPSNGIETPMFHSRSSPALLPDAEKTEAVYRGASTRKRKTAPQKSLSKSAAAIPKVEFAAPLPWARKVVGSSVPTKEILLLKEAIEVAEKQYQQTDFKGSLQTIAAILSKTDIFILGNKIFSKAAIQEGHLRLLKIKGLCLVEAVKEHISLESSVQIYAALSILSPLQVYETEDFETQKALAFCYCSLALCPSQKNIKAAHQLKADEAFKKAHDLRPADLSIIQEWFHLKVLQNKYQEAFQILGSVQTSLAECQERSILIPLLIDETLCYTLLALNKTEKLPNYYREQAQSSLKKLENLLGSEDREIRQFRTSYPVIFRNL